MDGLPLPLSDPREPRPPSPVRFGTAFVVCWRGACQKKPTYSGSGLAVPTVCQLPLTCKVWL